MRTDEIWEGSDGSQSVVAVMADSTCHLIVSYDSTAAEILPRTNVQPPHQGEETEPRVEGGIG